MKKNLFVLCLLAIIFSCDSKSDLLLSKGKMEDIIYDLNVAQQLNSCRPDENVAFNDAMCRKTVFEKYNVTEAEWDSSFNYYCRHTDQLHKIYLNVAERLRNDIVAAGGDVSDADGYGGDTTNVWIGEKTIVLLPYTPYNLKTYEVKADSTFLPGDRVTLSFDTKFLYQDGMKDVVANLVVTFSNDSTSNELRHVTSENTTIISIDDIDELGIKSIKGYMLFYRGMNEPISTTLRLASIYKIKLCHVHKEKKGSDSSLNSAVNKDTISSLVNDSVNKKAEDIDIKQVEGTEDPRPLTIDANDIKHSRIINPQRIR